MSISLIPIFTKLCCSYLLNYLNDTLIISHTWALASTLPTTDIKSKLLSKTLYDLVLAYFSAPTLTIPTHSLNPNSSLPKTSVPWIHHVFKDQHSLHKQVPCLKMIMPITFPPSISPFKRNHKGNLLWEVSISLRLKKLPPLNSHNIPHICITELKILCKNALPKIITECACKGQNVVLIIL